MLGCFEVQFDSAVLKGKVCFKKPKANADMKPGYDDKDKDGFAKWFATQIVSIEGLLNEDGSPLTVEQIAKQDLYVDQYSLLVHAYYAALRSPYDAEVLAKKFKVLD
jgi:hypothetical protein